MASASTGPSLSPPSQDSSLILTPRRDPLNRLGALKVQFVEPQKLSRHEKAYHVNCTFNDLEQQNRVFTQLVALEHAGIQKMDFSLRILLVDFVFLSQPRSVQFVERIKAIASALIAQGAPQASPDISPRIDHSPESSPKAPFSKWGQIQTEFSTEWNENLEQNEFSVKVTFTDCEVQKDIRRELTQLSDAGVIHFTYSFKDPIVTFAFYDEGKARTFMQNLEMPSGPAISLRGKTDLDEFKLV